MKILKLVLVLLCLAVFLTGCSQKNCDAVSLNETSLNANFSYNYLNLNYSGEISYQGESCTFIISSPKELEGYSICVLPTGINIMYDDILVQYPEDAFSAKFLFKQAFDAINEIKSNGFVKSGENMYKCSSNDFNAFADSKGNLIKLDFKNGELKLG